MMMTKEEIAKKIYDIHIRGNDTERRCWYHALLYRILDSMPDDDEQQGRYMIVVDRDVNTAYMIVDLQTQKAFRWVGSEGGAEWFWHPKEETEAEIGQLENNDSRTEAEREITRTKGIALAAKYDQNIFKVHQAKEDLKAGELVTNNQTQKEKQMLNAIAKVYEKTANAVVVHYHFGTQLREIFGDNFITECFVLSHSQELLTEALRLEAEEDARKK